MANDIIVTRADTFSNQFEANEGTIFSFVNNNPGSTLAQIATGAGVNEDLTNIILDVMVQSDLMVKRQGLSTEMLYFTMADWADALMTKAPAARTWIENNATGNVSELAPLINQFGMPGDEALAIALVYLLYRQGKAEWNNNLE